MYKKYQSLLNINYHNYLVLLITVILLMIILVLSISLYSYDKCNYVGVFNENQIFVNVLYNNSDAILKGTYMVIDKKQYKYVIKNISDLMIDNQINYQVYTIDFKDNSLMNNEIINITFYYNRQKIIKKIINFIF